MATVITQTERGPAISGKDATTGKPLKFEIGSIHHGVKFQTKGRFAGHKDVVGVQIVDLTQWKILVHEGDTRTWQVYAPRIGDKLSLRFSANEALDSMKEQFYSKR